MINIGEPVRGGKQIPFRKTSILGLVIFSLFTLPHCGLPFLKHKRAKISQKREAPLFTPDDGWLNISTRPYNFMLLLNGMPRYDEAGFPLLTPAVVRLAPGYYVVKLKQKGYKDWADTVAVAPKETTKVFVINNLWNEETYRRQEKYSLLVGVAMLILVMTLGLASRKGQFP